MARVKRVVTVCDMGHRHDEPATSRLSVELDGKRHDVDLCGQHRAEAMRDLRPWFHAGDAAARRREAARPASRTTTQDRRESAAIREWAAGQGINLPQRGRIPQAVKDRYYAAGGNKPV